MSERNENTPGSSLKLGRGNLADSKFAVPDDRGQTSDSQGAFNPRQPVSEASLKLDSPMGKSSENEAAPASRRNELSIPTRTREQDGDKRHPKASAGQEVADKTREALDGAVSDTSETTDHTLSNGQDARIDDTAAAEQTTGEAHGSAGQEAKGPVTQEQLESTLDLYAYPLSTQILKNLHTILPTQKKLLEDLVDVVGGYLNHLATEPNSIVLRFGYLVTAETLNEEIGRAVSDQLQDAVKAGLDADAMASIKQLVRTELKKMEARLKAQVASSKTDNSDELSAITARLEHASSTLEGVVIDGTIGLSESTASSIQKDLKVSNEILTQNADEIIVHAKNELDNTSSYDQTQVRSTASDILASARNDLESISSSAQEQLRNTASQILAHAKKELESTSSSAQQQLRSTASDLASELSSKVANSVQNLDLAVAELEKRIDGIGAISTLARDFKETLENQKQQHRTVCDDYSSFVSAQSGERLEARQLQQQSQQTASEASNTGVAALERTLMVAESLHNKQNELQNSFNSLSQRDTRSDMLAALQEVLPSIIRHIQAQPAALTQETPRNRDVEQITLLVTVFREGLPVINVCLLSRTCQSLASMIRSLAQKVKDGVPIAVIQDRSLCKKVQLQETVWSNTSWLPIDREYDEANSIYKSWFERNVTHGQQDGLEVRVWVNSTNNIIGG